MITAFSIGEDIRTVLSAKIEAIDIRKDDNGVPYVNYGVNIDYPNGDSDYHWIKEEDLLKFIEKEESENEPET